MPLQSIVRYLTFLSSLKTKKKSFLKRLSDHKEAQIFFIIGIILFGYDNPLKSKNTHENFKPLGLPVRTIYIEEPA